MEKTENFKLREPAGLCSFTNYLRSIGRSSVTGWRWRRLGWIQTVNIAGREYVTRDEIDRFESRACAGEFKSNAAAHLANVA